MFKNIRADLHAFNGNWGAQGFWVMIVYRFGRWRYGLRSTLLRKLCSAIYRILFKIVQILTGIEMPCEVVVGRNFVIDHFGGIIISGYASFGDDCRIRNGVVVGLRRVEEKLAQHEAQGVFRSHELQNLAGAFSVEVIHIPADNLSVAVSY